MTLIIIAIVAILLTIAITTLWLALDISRTSDKALEEHYKRNKK